MWGIGHILTHYRMNIKAFSGLTSLTNEHGFGMIKPYILVEYIVGSVHTFAFVFYFCKLFNYMFKFIK